MVLPEAIADLYEHSLEQISDYIVTILSLKSLNYESSICLKRQNNDQDSLKKPKSLLLGEDRGACSVLGADASSDQPDDVRTIRDPVVERSSCAEDDGVAAAVVAEDGGSRVCRLELRSSEAPSRCRKHLVA